MRADRRERGHKRDVQAMPVHGVGLKHALQPARGHEMVCVELENDLVAVVGQEVHLGVVERTREIAGRQMKGQGVCVAVLKLVQDGPAFFAHVLGQDDYLLEVIKAGEAFQAAQTENQAIRTARGQDD